MLYVYLPNKHSNFKHILIQILTNLAGHVGALSIQNILKYFRQCDSSFPDGGSCDSSSNGVTKADPESCQHYYQCVDSCVKQMTCDTGMAYDELYFMCRSSSEVDCGSRPCNDPAHCSSQTTTEKFLDCTPADQKINCTSAGIFPDLFNCRQVPKVPHVIDHTGCP